MGLHLKVTKAVTPRWLLHFESLGRLNHVYFLLRLLGSSPACNPMGTPLDRNLVANLDFVLRPRQHQTRRSISFQQ